MNNVLSFFIVPVYIYIYTKRIYNDCNVSIICFRIIKLFTIEKYVDIECMSNIQKGALQLEAQAEKQIFVSLFCVIYFRDILNLNEDILYFYSF